MPRKIKRKKGSLIRRIFLYALGAFSLYFLLCKIIMPPITLTQLQAVISGYGLKRDYVSRQKISPHFRLAAIASEDQLFPVHNGFDWRALEKSMDGKQLKRQKVRGAGASTITQQTAKNVFLWQGSGVMRYVRKVPELVITKLLEWVWGKDRILHVYLNVIETGPGIFGVEAAAQHYFNKSAAQVTRAEAAMIIACLPNPKKYTVKPLSKRVAWRHKNILKQMNNLAGDKAVQELVR